MPSVSASRVSATRGIQIELFRPAGAVPRTEGASCDADTYNGSRFETDTRVLHRAVKFVRGQFQVG